MHRSLPCTAEHAATADLQEPDLLEPDLQEPDLQESDLREHLDQPHYKPHVS